MLCVKVLNQLIWFRQQGEAAMSAQNAFESKRGIKFCYKFSKSEWGFANKSQKVTAGSYGLYYGALGVDRVRVNSIEKISYGTLTYSVQATSRTLAVMLH